MTISMLPTHIVTADGQHDLEEYLARTNHAFELLNGRLVELLDPTPHHGAVEMTAAPSMADMINQFLNVALEKRDREMVETYEEANDFDIDEYDSPPLTAYEQDYIPNPAYAPPTVDAVEPVILKDETGSDVTDVSTP